MSLWIVVYLVVFGVLFIGWNLNKRLRAVEKMLGGKTQTKEK